MQARQVATVDHSMVIAQTLSLLLPMRTTSTAHLLHDAWGDLRANWRPFLAYTIFYQLAAFAVLVPCTTWVTQRLVARSGDLAVSNTGIATFLLSPTGLAWIVLAGTFGIVMLYAASTGLLLMAWGHCSGAKVHPGTALFLTMRHLPRLAQLGLRHIRAHLLRAAPFAAIIGMVYVWLLSPYDIYYLVTTRPPVWWIALSMVAVVACGIVWVNGRLYLRWILSLPALLHGTLSPRASLEQSAKVMNGQTGRVIRPIVAVTVLMTASPFIIAIIFDLAGQLVFTHLPEKMVILLPAVVLHLSGHLLVTIAVSSAAVSLHAIVVARLYLSLLDEGALDAAPRSLQPEEPSGPAWSRGPVLTLAVALVAASTHAWYVVHRMDLKDRVTITAHRGSSLRAPENSLPAIELAVAEGAHTVELDFQELADGTVVMMHDTDFRRIAGTAQSVWEVDYASVKDLDVGSWFAPEYSTLRLKTLAEVLAVARGRVQLNIELKFHGREKAFVTTVVKALRDADFKDHCIVTSLNLGGLRAFRELAPAFRTGAILAKSLGNPMGLDAEVLAVSAGMANADFVASAHRAGKEVHVWTINDQAQMSRHIDRGADSIMTDDPLLLMAVLEERAAMSKEAKLLLKVRTLLRD